MQLLPSVLLIEDDRNISNALGLALRTSYDLERATTGAMALKLVAGRDFDIIVLDLNLPDVPGMTICQQLRDRGIKSPIVILTGDGSVMSKINLLDAGANDYLTKPFSLGELKARLRALNRKQVPAYTQVPCLIVGELELDRYMYTVRREGATIQLRRKEFAILECLMQHAGTTVSRDLLTRAVWHDKQEIWTNTIEVHIKHLRDKVDRPFSEQLIRTVHGRGYRLESTPRAAVSNLE